jgi:hypothetical protein
VTLQSERFPLPKIPRFPPGFTSKHNRLWGGFIAFGIVWCGGFAIWDLVTHNWISMCGALLALSINLFSLSRFYKVWRPMFDEWRIKRREILTFVEETRQVMIDLADEEGEK